MGHSGTGLSSIRLTTLTATLAVLDRIDALPELRDQIRLAISTREREAELRAALSDDGYDAFVVRFVDGREGQDESDLDGSGRVRRVAS